MNVIPFSSPLFTMTLEAKEIHVISSPLIVSVTVATAASSL
jgi:hypothetical protein